MSMTRSQRLKFAAYQDSFLRKAEQPFARRLARELKRFVTAAGQDVINNGGRGEAALYGQHQRRLLRLWDYYCSNTIRTFAKLQVTLRKNLGHDFETKQITTINGLVARYLAQYAATRISEISKTTRKKIKAALLETGTDTPAAEKALRSIVGQQSARAYMIAATELHAASQFAAIESNRELSSQTGIEMYKAWVPTLDDRTRPTHAEMNPDEFIPVNQPFVLSDGDILDRPGDPSGRPENVINCRCIVVFEEKEFVNQ